MTPSSMSPAYVVDTSVAVKWYVEREESDTAPARKLLEAFARGDCILRAPEFLLFEIANALLMGHRRGATVVKQILSQVQNLELELETLKPPVLAKAVEIAAECSATIYDSYFLALAIETGSVLVTADDAFVRKAGHYPELVSLRQLRLPSAGSTHQ